MLRGSWLASTSYGWLKCLLSVTHVHLLPSIAVTVPPCSSIEMTFFPSVPYFILLTCPQSDVVFVTHKFKNVVVFCCIVTPEMTLYALCWIQKGHQCTKPLCVAPSG